MFLDCRRKLEYQVRTHPSMGKTCNWIPCRKTPVHHSNPGPSYFKVKVLTTVPQCSPRTSYETNKKTIFNTEMLCNGQAEVCGVSKNCTQVRAALLQHIST
ncbi:hypothetical protein AMECASPLE_022147 [Ameca splendens]|uniref:Uncharacterized protein n=1 Tax=Ameca splendens TaxID=208324 RepID=A0ABV0Y4B2_9TELE